MNLRALKAEIIRAYRLKGINGLLAGANTVIMNSLPSAVAPPISGSNDRFDALYGVCTAEPVRLSELSINAENWVFGQKYEAVPMHDFQELMNGLHISYNDYTFIDMGSGKGRAVLLAAMLPFGKVIGIEFSESLVDISRNNLKMVKQDVIICKNIQIICQDASLYNLSSESTVIFFNNPFRLNIFKKVIDKISISKGRLIIIYYNTINDDGCVAYLESLAGITRTAKSGNHAVFVNYHQDDT
jgi:16S rRNA G966 N2-methylase RsmD